uniref:Uncharacterized protein n=1 Tax=Oryza nivara TaxID=4536 RepID=A0A0E0IZD3_ORYNI
MVKKLLLLLHTPQIALVLANAQPRGGLPELTHLVKQERARGIAGAAASGGSSDLGGRGDEEARRRQVEEEMRELHEGY